MIIRSYTESDFEGIKQVIHSVQTEECWPFYYPNGWDNRKILSEFNPLKNCRDSIFLVSEAEGQITGLIAGHDLDSFIEQEIPHLRAQFDELGIYQTKAFYQRDIILHKIHQRGTLGLRLFRDLQKHASETGYSTLVTRTPPLNSRGITFFSKLGYQEICEDSNPERVYFMMSLKPTFD
ncbi:MAG: hypothetical protein KAI26_05965 [Nanoarchaeota archaeon]|nr:hypothetical protein [Nanoarchaeota archaeon]